MVAGVTCPSVTSTINAAGPLVQNSCPAEDECSQASIAAPLDQSFIGRNNSGHPLPSLPTSSQDSAKNRIIDNLIDDSVQGKERQVIKKALSLADRDRLSKVTEFGTKIHIDPEKKLGSGGYNTFNKSITLSGKDFAIEKLLTHNLNHELMGHAYLAARAFNSTKGIKKSKMLTDNLMILALGTRGLKKDVRDLGTLPDRYRDRVLVDKAAAIRDAVLGIVAWPEKTIPAEAVIKMVDSSCLLSEYISFDDAIKQYPALSKEQALSFLSSFAGQAMGLEQLQIEPQINGEVKVSFHDPSKKAYGLLVNKPLAMAGVGAALGVLAAAGAGIMGAGLVAVSAAALLPGPLGYGAGKLMKNLYQKGWPGKRSRQVEMSGFKAELEQKRNDYTITLPLEAHQCGAQWSPRGFLARNAEEYLAEAMSLANESPESRERLKNKDPELFDYLVARNLIS